MSLLTSLQVHDVPRVKLRVGDKVTEEGAPGCKVYVMIKGIVEVSISKQVIATVLEPGAIFGEIAAMCGCNHSATVVALEESEFFVIDDFRGFLKRNPEESLTVIKSLCERIVLMNDNEVSRKVLL
ncbi:MAG: cyclic nucleotide-binding domain-containing protein [Lentisphaerales bacterium]|nr:cyclic nucleotide-binding domain-containing protein [Lentisphaerales bacterium]